VLHFDHVAAIGDVNAWSWTTAVSATNTPGRVFAFVKIICSSQRALFVVVVRVHRCVSIREVRQGVPPKNRSLLARNGGSQICNENPAELSFAVP
jgi:hypothetical protein